MSSINFKNLSKNTSSVNQNVTYTDLALDITIQEKRVSATNSRQVIAGKDIALSVDEEAIVNSIFNILNTRPTQRFLVPTFGCNLLGYISMPCTDITGREIGNTIYRAIQNWEPRVNITQVLVVSHPDLNQFTITISMIIPTLSKRNVSFSAVLNKQGLLDRKVNN